MKKNGWKLEIRGLRKTPQIPLKFLLSLQEKQGIHYTPTTEMLQKEYLQRVF